MGGPPGTVNFNPAQAAQSETAAVGFMAMPQGNRQAGLHIHSVTEIYVILKGEIEGYDHTGVPHRAGPGDCIYIPAGVPHGVRTVGDEDLHLIWVHDAIERLGVNRYDVAVLDRDMPHRTGDEVCRWAVESAVEARILILTAAAGIRDRVDGLSLGADDYLTKPFAFAELAARIQTLARRPAAGSAPVLEHAGIVLDIPKHRAFRDGRLLDLTPKEFAVLGVLMRSAGSVVSAEELLEKAWTRSRTPCASPS